MINKYLIAGFLFAGVFTANITMAVGCQVVYPVGPHIYGLASYPSQTSPYPPLTNVEPIPLPVNTFFLGASPDAPLVAWIYEDKPIAYETDEALTAIFSSTFSDGISPESVFRPKVSFEIGSIIESNWCVSGPCVEYVITKPDLTPPAKAIIDNLRVNLTLNVTEGDAICGSPVGDTMTMNIESSDESDGQLIGLAYIEDSAIKVKASSLPQAVFPKKYGQEPEERIFLGTNQERDGLGFRRSEYCFAIAWMDRSGNIGEKSDIECISTLDEDAEYAKVQDLGCSSTSPNSFGLFTLVGAFLVLIGRKRD